MRKTQFFLFFFVSSFLLLYGQEETKKIYDSKDFYITKGKGFEFHFFDDSYLLQVDFRGQFRASFPYNKFPVESGDFEDTESSLGINRARIKIGGYVYKPYFTYYLEEDLVGGNLLDFRIQIEKLPYLQLRLGQWKARYSRERIISSGKQQALDRSMINRIFTIDRQQGISLYGKLEGKGAANVSYWASVFTGMGRGQNNNDDSNFMYMGRLQWNPNAKELGFSGSDLKFHEKFIASVALAAVTNTSPYTAFSTNGGGQLFGFEPGQDGQYKVDQFMIETAFKYKGLSWQQEWHYKNVDDKVNLEETLLTGNYIQLGYFFHYAIEKFPKPLEFFVRHAYYDADANREGNSNFEYTAGCNWFFRGHKNKLTFDYSYLEYNEFAPDFKSGSRVRLQWDISIF